MSKEEKKNEKKKIKVVSGDGNIQISPVSSHLDIEKPKTRKKTTLNKRKSLDK